MKVMVLKPEHQAVFSPFFPRELSGCLEEPDKFVLGLLDQQADGWHPMGVLVAQVEEDLVEILWVYVLDEAGGQGNGTLLVQTLLRLLSGSGSPCTVMVFLEAGDPVSLFFLYAGFDLVGVGSNNMYTTTVGALVEGKLGNRPTLAGILPLREVPKVYLRVFNHAMSGSDAKVEFPIRPEDYLSCSVALIEQGKVTGVLLYAQEPGETGLSMVYQYVAGGDPRRAAALTCASVSAMGKSYPPETPVRLLTLDKLSQLMASSCTDRAEEARIIALTYEVGDDHEKEVLG